MFLLKQVLEHFQNNFTAIDTPVEVSVTSTTVENDSPHLFVKKCTHVFPKNKCLNLCTGGEEKYIKGRMTNKRFKLVLVAFCQNESKLFPSSR